MKRLKPNAPAVSTNKLKTAKLTITASMRSTMTKRIQMTRNRTIKKRKTTKHLTLSDHSTRNGLSYANTNEQGRAYRFSSIAAILKLKACPTKCETGKPMSVEG